MPIKQWNSTQWVPIGEIKQWDGTQWIPIGEVKQWDGTQWVSAYTSMKYLTVHGGTNVNLQSVLTANGIAKGSVTITNTGTMSASSTGHYACQTGDLSAYKEVIFVNQGVIQGYGGGGGRGGYYGGYLYKASNGDTGGAGLLASSPIKLNNLGVIRGGGGGGGGGRYSSGSCNEQ